MAGNVPNTSRDSFDYSKLYDKLAIQQGVPIPDSDWNEMNDVLRFSQLLSSFIVLGNLKLPAQPSNNYVGYTLLESTSPTNNFEITPGWALVGGILVPTVLAEPPTAHDYEDDTNLMDEGTVTSFSDPTLTDDDKNWQSFHSLVGCRVKMTSGTESGNSFTIATNPTATTITVGGSPSISPGDTYIIKPPALTTPGGSRTDEVYIMVWWDDINENEDSNIEHPGLGVETCHRSKRKWCVRVAEGGSTPSTPANFGFGVRYMKIAELARTASASILASMITNELWDKDSPVRFVDSSSFYSAPATDSTSGGIGSVDDLSSCLEAIDNAIVRRRTAITLADNSARTMADYLSSTVLSYINSIGNGGTYFLQKVGSTVYIPSGGNIGDTAEDPELVGEIATGGHDGYADVAFQNGGATDCKLQGRFRRLHFRSADFNNFLQIGYSGSRGETTIEDCGIDSGHAIFRGFSANTRPIIIRNVEFAPGSGPGPGAAAMDLLQSLGTYPFIIFEDCIIRGPHASATSQAAVLRIKDMGAYISEGGNAVSRLIMFNRCQIIHENITTIPTVLLDTNANQIVAFQDCRVIGIAGQTQPVFHATGYNRIRIKGMDIEAPSGQAIRLENAAGPVEDLTIFTGDDTTVSDPQCIGMSAWGYMGGLEIRNLKAYLAQSACRTSGMSYSPVCLGSYLGLANAHGAIHADGVYVRPLDVIPYRPLLELYMDASTSAAGQRPGNSVFSNVHVDLQSVSTAAIPNGSLGPIVSAYLSTTYNDKLIIHGLKVTDIPGPDADWGQSVVRFRGVHASDILLGIFDGSSRPDYSVEAYLEISNSIVDRVTIIGQVYTVDQVKASNAIIDMSDSILRGVDFRKLVISDACPQYIRTYGNSSIADVIFPPGSDYNTNAYGIYAYGGGLLNITACQWDFTSTFGSYLINLAGCDQAIVTANNMRAPANATAWIRSGSIGAEIVANNILKSTNATNASLDLNAADSIGDGTNNLLINT